MSENSQFLAGFGRCDITPSPDFPNGIWMAQKHIRATGVHRRLYASCLIIGNDLDSVALISFDLTILSATQIAAIRQAVHYCIGLPEDRIWVYVTHNHAGPVTQDFYDREGAEEVREYISALPVKASRAAAQAWNRRSPARASSGAGNCSIGVNRDLNFNGQMITGPNLGGFADPTVSVMRLDSLQGAPLAALITYGCHPTFLGPQNTLISPDYPGVTRDTFEMITSVPCLFLQAGAGNVGPMRGFLPDICEVERCGKILGCEAAQTFLGIPASSTHAPIDHVIESGAPLGVVRVDTDTTAPQPFASLVTKIRLPTDNPGPTVYDTVERDLQAATQRIESLRAQASPEPDIQHATQQLLRHRLRLDRKRMYAVAEGYPLELCAFRVGDVYFLSAACEPYAELATEIRRRSPSHNTVFAGYEGADVIYVAPAAAYRTPIPMEVFNSPFGPGAADILVDGAIALLQQLKAGVVPTRQRQQISG